MQNKEIFFCYAREDEELRLMLEKQLRGLQRQQLITTWHDRNITAGTEWEKAIDMHLNNADIILLLISPDFIASDYCYGIEMEQAMKRHQRGEACVIPIILRPTHWQNTPFGKLQALPKDGVPVTSKQWYDQDEAFFNITQGIIETLRNQGAFQQKRSFENETLFSNIPPNLPTKKTRSNSAIVRGSTHNETGIPIRLKKSNPGRSAVQRLSLAERRSQRSLTTYQSDLLTWQHSVRTLRRRFHKTYIIYALAIASVSIPLITLFFYFVSGEVINLFTALIVALLATMLLYYFFIALFVAPRVNRQMNQYVQDMTNHKLNSSKELDAESKRIEQETLSFLLDAMENENRRR